MLSDAVDGALSESAPLPGGWPWPDGTGEDHGPFHLTGLIFAFSVLAAPRAHGKVTGYGQRSGRTRLGRFGAASRDLAQEIADSGFQPDIILAIARGGLFVAGALGYALSVKNLHVMNVEFYNGVGTTLDMPVMLPPVPSAVDFSAKKVLIADDVADTGKTLELVRNSSPITWPRSARP